MRRLLYGKMTRKWGKIVMDSAEYPEVTFENSPKEVELKLIEK